jgi:hypothetical protein
VIAFAVCDFLFSLLLLTLFAVPLRNHLRVMKDIDEQDQKLYHLIKKNLILSTLICLSTVGSLTGMAVLWSTHTVEVRREEQFWHIYALFIPSCDMVFSACVGLLITNNWMPLSLAEFSKRMFKYSEEDLSSSRRGSHKVMQSLLRSGSKSKLNTTANSNIVVPESQLSSDH